jgi:cytidine deaminase
VRSLNYRQDYFLSQIEKIDRQNYFFFQNIVRYLMQYSKLIQTAKTILGEFQLAKSELTAGSVSCALITDQGNVYTGICLDLACGIGFCAEHSAIAEMLKARETKIDCIVAVGLQGIMMPCGRCRELMMQVNQENINTKIVINEKSHIFLQDLLPKHWL